MVRSVSGRDASCWPGAVDAVAAVPADAAPSMARRLLWSNELRNKLSIASADDDDGLAAAAADDDDGVLRLGAAAADLRWVAAVNKRRPIIWRLLRVDDNWF